MSNRKPTPEQLRMAVRLCNSNGILICGVMAERRVAQLLVTEMEHAALLIERDEWAKAARRAVEAGEQLAASLMVSDTILLGIVQTEAPEALAHLRNLPSAADLDADAEEKGIRAATGHPESAWRKLVANAKEGDRGKQFMQTHFVDISRPECESREYAAENFSSSMGRSTIRIRCPFCGALTIAYKWSLAGGGKRCGGDGCGALFGSMGNAYHLKEDDCG